MQLNGITPRPGTIIGYHWRAKKFLIVDHVDDDGCVLRFATSLEMNKVGTYEPMSVTEHRGVARRSTPYGLARMFGPRPFVKPQVVRSTPPILQDMREAKYRKQASRLIRKLPVRGSGYGDNGR